MTHTKSNNKMVVCNCTTKVEHCYHHCIHGKPHLKDECLGFEICNIVNKRVKCRKLFTKELKELAEHENN